MKKLLLTLTERNNSYITILFFLLLFGISNSIQAQTFTALTDCDCLNNEISPGSGQFKAKIFVHSEAGENWIIVESDGFYDFSQPNPAPTVLYPVGQELLETPDVAGSVYTLEGLHMSDYIWSVKVSNGTEIITITASHTCAYPDKIIRGDKDVCNGNTEDYWINEPLSNIVGPLTWSLSGGGSMTTFGNRVTIDWSNTPGTHTLGVTGTSKYGCDIDEEVTIYIRNNDPITLACNNLVNLSMNIGCEVEMVPEMFLEDMQLTADAYEIKLRHVEMDTLIPNGIITGEYIGIPIEVTVIHQCSGNSCWSTVNIEDKGIPDLECTLPDTLECDETIIANLSNLPIPAGVTAIDNGDGGFILYGFDGCGEATLTYSDQVVSENLCTGDFSSAIIRHWTVVDGSGSTSTCDNIIYVKRATLDDIVFPGHWDTALGPNPTIPACSNFPKLPNGHPDPSYTGRPEGTFCLNAEVSFRDVRLSICGEHSFKIVRKWKVIDLCSNTILTSSQNITVMDNVGPVVVAPPEYAVDTDQNNCGSQISVKPPLSVIDCSNWDYYVSYKLRDESGDPATNATTDGVIGSKAAGYTILNIPPGQDSVWIMYNVFDDCGNFTTAFTEVAIIDTEEPVAICDLHTFVGLNEDGHACVGPKAFDDGSWDNCGVARIEIERMDGNPCDFDCPDGMIGFCCDDIGEIVMVRMTVWDYAGNSNTCMVEAEAQDNIPPVLENCPKNITVNCASLPLSYSQYGSPSATDACNVTITETVTENINECGEGTIVRYFTAVDNDENEVSCSQTITVKALNPFSKSNIIFPGNYTFLNGCSDTGAKPEDLPFPFNKVRITNRPCSQVAVTYEDKVFQFADDACFKILRKWTVIDWCQYVPLPYEPPYDVLGKWTHEQVIKIMNTTAPTITKGCDDVIIDATPNDNCQLAIELSAVANDDCSSAEHLVWSYAVDLNNNGSIDRTGTTNDASGLYPSGAHKVTWSVSDDCGNTTTCMQIVNVRDDKNPTPYCYGGIVSVMPEEGVLAIWASDFDKGSFDNCPGDNNVKVAFSSNPNDTGRVFTCSDLTGLSDTFDIQMYVIDDEGNFDFCDTKFIIQDNNNVCPDTVIDPEGEGSILSLGGHIYTADNEMISDVDVLMVDYNSEHNTHDITEDGVFAFHNLSMNGNYLIEPSKDSNYMEGVSTLDLILIQRHILKLKTLDSPYKVIAADIDNSGRISALDLIQLRKLILGKYTELPNNASWRFVDAASEFENEEVPFPFIEKVSLKNVDEHNMKNDFIAVKIGDVDNSLNVSGIDDNDTRNNETINFNYTSNFDNGVSSMNVFATEKDDIEGFQTTLRFDASKYEFIDIKPGQLLMTINNVNTSLVERGIITISYNEAVSVEDLEEVLFQINFNSKTSTITGMEFNSEKVKSEIYTSVNGDITIQDLQLNAQKEEAITKGFELFQNVPNPFGSSTTIDFYMNEGNQVTIKVFDLTGKVLYRTNKYYDSGMNKIILNTKDINASGVLYYQLETSAGTLSNKMIIIK